MRFLARLTTGLVACALLLSCTGAASPLPGATPTEPALAVPASEAPPDSFADDTPGVAEFSGTSDDVVAEVTNAGMTCGPALPSKGFELQACSSDSATGHLHVDVYARPSGDLVGVDMTATSNVPMDPDSLMSFVAFGLGGAMGPDAFNTVSDQLTTRLDGSSPEPVWVGTDLRLTVQSNGDSVEVTLLTRALAAVWGS